MFSECSVQMSSRLARALIYEGKLGSNLSKSELWKTKYIVLLTIRQFGCIENWFHTFYVGHNRSCSLF